MTDNLNEGFVLSDVLISLGRVSQHGEYQDSKPNQPFFNFIVYARAFPPVTSKGPRMKGVKSLPKETLLPCFTQDFDLTLHVKILQMKSFPCTLHFFFSAFLPLIDPKRNMWSVELKSLTSGLILPHVPEMKPFFFFLICTYMYTNDWADLFHVFVSLPGKTLWKKKKKKDKQKW